MLIGCGVMLLEYDAALITTTGDNVSLNELEAPIKDVAKFFRAETDMTLRDFNKMWQELTDADKAELRAGIGDGTYDY